MKGVIGDERLGEESQEGLVTKLDVELKVDSRSTVLTTKPGFELKVNSRSTGLTTKRDFELRESTVDPLY